MIYDAFRRVKMRLDFLYDTVLLKYFRRTLRALSFLTNQKREKFGGMGS
jgi:hypothetical protein